MVFSEGAGLVDVEEAHPGFSALFDVLGTVDQDFVVFDSGGEEQFLVVRQLVDIVLELGEVFSKILNFLGLVELEDPSYDQGSYSYCNGDGV